MNAVMRERDEKPVIANETIEASIGFMRTSIEDVKADVRGLQADNRSLRDKIDDTRTELSGRIEQVRSELVDKMDEVSVRFDDKIEQVSARLDGKIDQASVRLDGKIDQVNAGLGAKIDQLSSKLGETNVCVAKVATSQKVMFWLIGVAGSAAALLEMVVRVGEKFHWF